MATKPASVTAEELLTLGNIGRCELIEGELVRISPSGFEHGRIAANIAAILHQYTQARKLGVITGAETGFKIATDPDTVRAPDAAFISAGRVPTERKQEFFVGPPDLAVEVISPHDSWAEVTAKSRAWLEAGCPQVWLVDPDAHTIHVCRANDRVTVLDAESRIDASEVIPGLQVSVRDIFAA